MLKISQIAISVLCAVLFAAVPESLAGASFNAKVPRVKRPSAHSGPRNGGFGRLVVRNSYFREMVREQAQSCESRSLPQPLATPSPMLDSTDNTELTVSFVVGIDGRVHGALVLEGNRMSQASLILDTVRLWRFRPAVCNGAPTEAEAKVEFSTPPNRF